MIGYFPVLETIIDASLISLFVMTTQSPIILAYQPLQCVLDSYFPLL